MGFQAVYDTSFALIFLSFDPVLNNGTRNLLSSLFHPISYSEFKRDVFGTSYKTTLKLLFQIVEETLELYFFLDSVWNFQILDISLVSHIGRLVVSNIKGVYFENVI